jgi:exonuclease VII small subunit
MTDQSRVGPSDVAELSYEQARAEPAAVVERLEAGGCTLPQARPRLDAGAEHTQ